MKLFTCLLGLASVFASWPSYDVTHTVTFEISIGGVDQGAIDIGLFGETVPKTVKNFCDLANGVEFSPGSGKEGYEGYELKKNFCKK
jgi:hypothetical protein